MIRKLLTAVKRGSFFSDQWLPVTLEESLQCTAVSINQWRILQVMYSLDFHAFFRIRQNDVLYLDMVYLGNIPNEEIPFSLSLGFNRFATMVAYHVSGIQFI